MEKLSNKKIGICIYCQECGKLKQPWGRSVPISTANIYCYHDNCEGWDKEPLSGSLFPGESEYDFGYPCSDNGTKIIDE